MTLPRVALVVVAFGHADDLPALLRSLDATEYPPDKRELIVVDNGDGATAAVARELCARSTGARTGRKPRLRAQPATWALSSTTADIILLVNPDIVLAPTTIGALCAALADPQVGIVGGRLLFPDGTTLQHAGGELHLPLGLTTHRGRGSAQLQRVRSFHRRDLCHRRIAGGATRDLATAWWLRRIVLAGLLRRSRSVPAGAGGRSAGHATCRKRSPTHRETAALGRSSTPLLSAVPCQPLALAVQASGPGSLSSRPGYRPNYAICARLPTTTRSTGWPGAIRSGSATSCKVGEIQRHG